MKLQHVQGLNPPAPLGYVQQQSEPGMSQLDYAQQPQQSQARTVQQQSQPQQGIGQWVYVPQPQQGFAQQIQQPLWGYVSSPPQQGITQQEYARQLQPGLTPQAQLPQQGISGQWGYAPQPQPGFAPAGIAQLGMAPLGYAPQQPQQDFAGQAGQFAGGYDIYQRRDVPHARRGPKNYTRSDERIREVICERLIQDLSIDVSDVSIEVQSGQVTLSGTVPDRHMKHAIEDVVDGCWGVDEIENDMRVQSTQAQEAGFSASGTGQRSAKTGQSGGGFAGSSGASGVGKAKAVASESKGRSTEE